MSELKRTCGACYSFKRCEAFGVAKPDNTECDWAPSRFAWSDRHVAALQAERDEYRNALIDIRNCWMVELADAKPETRAAIDKAIGA